MADLRIRVSDATSPTVIVLEGSVELSTARRLRDRLNAIAASGVGEVVIDLTDAWVIDAAGTGILLASVDRLSAGGHVVVRAPSPTVRDFLNVMAATSPVTVEPS